MGFLSFKFFCTYATLPPLSNFFFDFQTFQLFFCLLLFPKQNAQKHAESIFTKNQKTRNQTKGPAHALTSRKQKGQRTPSQTEKKGPAHVLKQK